MTKRKKLKRRVRARMLQVGENYTTALAATCNVDPLLEKARANRREYVQLAQDWVAGKPLDPEVVRRVVLRPADWGYLDRVQQEIPAPEKAWPEFAGVMYRAKQEIEAAYQPTMLGPRPKEPDAAVRRILDGLWERIELAKRERTERPDGRSLYFFPGLLTQLLDVELRLRPTPLPQAVEAEIRRLLIELDRVSPREPEPPATASAS